MTNREDSNRKRALRDILSYEDTLTVDVENTVHKIRERAKTLHSELDMYVTNLLNQIKHKFEQELKKVRYTVEKLKTGDLSPRGKAMSRSSSLDRSPRYRSTPRSNIDFGLNTSRTSVRYGDVDEMHQFDKKEIHFFEGEASDKVFERLVGTYTFEATTPISFNAVQRSILADRKSEVKLVKTFKVGDKSETVHAIAPVEEDQAWICCGWGSRNLSLYDRHGQKRKTASLDIQVNDACTFHDGKEDAVLVSSFREKSIKRLNQESLRTSDFAYTSLFPGGLAADRRSGIYVCFRDSYQRQAIFGSRRMVAKLSKHGELGATVEKNEEQTNIFGYPFRIAVNMNGDVCVSDYGDGTRGVTILAKDDRSKELRVKCWYKGPPTGIGSDQPFLPHGIVCDEEGHILVSDWNNDCIHVLDRDGNFLLNLIGKKDGLEGPNALGLDKRGYLWVGDSHGVVRVFKYSVYDG
ncbi:uncharacterized protein LOC123545493 [Mercenaria mercenaria]|uniref:uncharacterized protein LOC123545493 n=1 Tax=Mercenaria mercenaria TaxID=6596 RepID=UPI00234E59D9|nr:uncharacterized protein LOC123545493 [Mercenaria mercenaria]